MFFFWNRKSSKKRIYSIFNIFYFRKRRKKKNKKANIFNFEYKPKLTIFIYLILAIKHIFKNENTLGKKNPMLREIWTVNEGYIFDL